MGVDQNRKQRLGLPSDGILTSLCAKPESFVSMHPSSPTDVSREPLFPVDSEVLAGPVAKQYQKTLPEHQGLSDCHQFGSSQDSEVSEISSLHLEQKRERVEVHPLMGGGYSSQPTVSQSLNYQMTKQRQRARCVVMMIYIS